jgi:hypothetical protein
MRLMKLIKWGLSLNEAYILVLISDGCPCNKLVEYTRLTDNKVLTALDKLHSYGLVDDCKINYKIYCDVMNNSKIAKVEGEDLGTHWLLDHAKTLKNVARMRYQLKEKDCDELINKWGKKNVIDILERMDNYGELTKKNVYVFKTAKNWLTRSATLSKPTGYNGRG